MIKKILFLSTSILTALTLTNAAVAIELTAGHAGSQSYFYHAALTKMAELVDTRSKGEVTLNIFPDAQLGGEVKMLQSARTGTLDITVVASAVLESVAKEYAVFSFPYLFADSGQADRLLRGPLGQEFLDQLPGHGLVGLGFLASVERNIYTTGKPIEKAEDVRGLKIRVAQSPGYIAAYEALGAQPTPMAAGELYLALENKVVDAGETSPDLFMQSKYFEVSKVYSLAKVNYMPTIMVINADRFNALPSESQALIREAAQEGIDYAVERYRQDYRNSLNEIKSAGVKVIEPDIASFVATAPFVYATLLKEFPTVAPWLDKIKAATQP